MAYGRAADCARHVQGRNAASPSARADDHRHDRLHGRHCNRGGGAVLRSPVGSGEDCHRCSPQAASSSPPAATSWWRRPGASWPCPRCREWSHQRLADSAVGANDCCCRRRHALRVGEIRHARLRAGTCDGAGAHAHAGGSRRPRHPAHPGGRGVRPATLLTGSPVARRHDRDRDGH